MTTRQDKKRINEKKKALILKEDSPFAVVEAYKALRTNIIFSLPGSGCECIAITSTERAEGKSTNSVNLAISFGQIGKKILLIDADMRLPSVAPMLEIDSRPGLSNLLIEEAKADEVITHVEKYGIDVIPAGNIPPDPTRLLGSGQMETLISELRGRYDYILIDLPPANTVTDALILSNYVDGYLLLVKHNSTEYRDIGEMVSRFRMTGGKILGFLYVDASAEHHGYFRKYGRYGSKYGYK